MTGRLRIGLETPAWPGHNTANGITTAVYHLALGLRDIGHPPVILTGDIDGRMPEGIPVTIAEKKPWNLTERIDGKLRKSRIPEINRRKSIEAMSRIIRDARREHGLDIVIIEETFGWAKDIAPQVPVPVVVFLHGPWLIHKHFQSWGTAAGAEAREKAEERAFRTAAGILSPSRAVLETIEAAYDLGGIPRGVIANCYAAPDMRTVPPPEGPILFVGRYDRHKGGDTVLAAFDALVRAHPQARLSFVGPDRGLLRPDGRTTRLKDDIAALSPDARSRLSVLGQRDSGEIQTLRGTHPIALIASRYELFGYTMLEAMAAGQAIVATDTGGPGEVLKDGETALLVPPDDPAAMAGALGRLLDDPALTRRLGQAARAEAEASFHPETIAAETVAFCRRVLASPTQP